METAGRPLRFHRHRSPSSPAPRNGIGAACAERLFAAERRRGRAVGRRRRAAARRSPPSSSSAARRRAVYRAATSRAEREVDAALAATLAAFGRVDALVNNAGIFRAARLPRHQPRPTGTRSSTSTSRARSWSARRSAREMAKSGGGAIVNMSSVNGVMAIPSIASYNASKGGIDQLTRVMALALADTRHPRQRGRAGHDRHRAGEEGRARQRRGDGARS